MGVVGCGCESYKDRNCSALSKDPVETGSKMKYEALQAVAANAAKEAEAAKVMAERAKRFCNLATQNANSGPLQKAEQQGRALITEPLISSMEATHGPGNLVTPWSRYASHPPGLYCEQVCENRPNTSAAGNLELCAPWAGAHLLSSQRSPSSNALAAIGLLRFDFALDYKATLGLIWYLLFLLNKLTSLRLSISRLIPALLADLPPGVHRLPRLLLQGREDSEGSEQRPGHIGTLTSVGFEF
eukprot:s4_g16.t2